MVYYCLFFGTTDNEREVSMILGVNPLMKNYNSKREDLEEEDRGEDERNVIL